MTRRPTVHHDAEQCIGCHACEVQCKTHQGLGAGPAGCRIAVVEASAPRRLQHAFVRCSHCDEAPCVSACPSGALQRRASDGLVLVEESQCLGCLGCLYACPSGALQFDEAARRVVKCDGCADRLDAGLPPACVATCVTGCLTLGHPVPSSVPRPSS